MTAETILTALVRINLAASVAIVLVLALRPLVLRGLGASVAYWFWLVVPIAAAASILPAREEIVLIQPTASLLVEEVPAGRVEASPTLLDGASGQVATTPGSSSQRPSG
jgi:beta-lactamase regulating signal transducer with metallopeptidase domain